MSDRDDIRRPTDHLPPSEERHEDETSERPHYPVEAPAEESAISPDTAAEPDKPDRHGVAKLPSGPR